MSVVRTIGLIVALIATGACGGGGEDDAAACAEAMNHNDLFFVQTEVFTPSCSVSTSCHRGSARSAYGLNLEEEPTDADFIAKVNVASMLMEEYFPEMPALNVVKPGDSNNSYLVVLMEGAPASLIANDPLEGPITMPQDNDKLCQPKIDAVRRWIDGLTPPVPVN